MKTVGLIINTEKKEKKSVEKGADSKNEKVQKQK